MNKEEAIDWLTNFLVRGTIRVQHDPFLATLNLFDADGDGRGRMIESEWGKLERGKTFVV